jgi:hypothetical protein
MAADHEPHPLVARVLAVTPLDACGEVVRGVEHDAGFDDWEPTIYGPAEPIAARQIAEVLRWLADAWKSGWHNNLDLVNLADEIEALYSTEGDPA